MPKGCDTRVRRSGGQALAPLARGPGALGFAGLILAGLLVAGLLGVAARAGAWAQEIHSAHCLFGCPFGGPRDNDVIVRDLYILSHNDRRKFADWVAYRVDPKNFGARRPRRLVPDPLLAPSERLEAADYKGAHAALSVDRGHQAPLGSFTGAADWQTVNYFSNISPQASALNGGPWRALEEAVRQLSRARRGPVYVVTGPAFQAPRPALPNADEAHAAPSAYWKIVAVPAEGRVVAAAFLMDQATPATARFCDYRVAVSRVAAVSGLAFFHGLDARPGIVLSERPGEMARRLGCAG